MSKIYLNAGHGGKDPGALNGTRRESNDVLRLALAVKPLLEAAGHKVTMSRTDDTFTDVTMIAKNANASGADLFIALHRNSFSDPTANGNECLICSKASATAKKLAQGILNRINAVGGRNRGVRVQDKNTYVLQNTKMPATTVELGFISNAEDNRLFDERFQDYAQAIAQGICDVLGGSIETAPQQPSTPAPAPTPTPTPSPRNLKVASPLLKGNDVLEVQSKLKALLYPAGSVDGAYGAKTEKAVRLFQEEHKKEFALKVDGIVGPQTLSALNTVYCRAMNPSWSVGKLLKYQPKLMTGKEVANVQTALMQKGYSIGKSGVDGKYGEDTQAAVKAFQTKRGLTIDGIVGKNTVKALGGKWG